MFYKYILSYNICIIIHRVYLCTCNHRKQSTLLLGVTHLPEIHKVDLDIIFNKLEMIKSASNSGSGGNVAIHDDIASSTICLVLATDGVWDNWLYEDVNKFVMDATCIGAVASNADGAKRVAQSFMQRNALYAKRNFGSSADNATIVILYLSRSTLFPVSM